MSRKVGHGTEKVKKVKELKCHTGQEKHTAESFSVLWSISIELQTKNTPSNVSLATVVLVHPGLACIHCKQPSFDLCVFFTLFQLINRLSTYTYMYVKNVLAWTSSKITYPLQQQINFEVNRYLVFLQCYLVSNRWRGIEVEVEVEVAFLQCKRNDFLSLLNVFWI